MVEHFPWSCFKKTKSSLTLTGKKVKEKKKSIIVWLVREIRKNLFGEENYIVLWFIDKHVQYAKKNVSSNYYACISKQPEVNETIK